MKLKEIYSDGHGKIKAGNDELTGSIVLKVEYKKLNPESITFPNDAIDNLIMFLDHAKNGTVDWMCFCGKIFPATVSKCQVCGKEKNDEDGQP